ncbi:MAG: Gfo/Idh/MocA family oxidoreductase [Candidatus Hydrogenedentes bacterium]|nr:Gfo/Idh/MocA family oxidoreductase [Candidatus Hydrogenedentota bacterium]
MRKKTDALKVAVIGCGAIAQERHLPYWRELEEEGRVHIAGLCDVFIERCESEAKLCKGAKIYSDYKTMLREDRFDIVDICTQNRLHAPIALSALEAGANVLVEKPIAMSTAEAKKMVDTAKKKNRKLMVAQHMRFEAGAEKLKEVVDKGTLGRIYTAEAKWLRKRGIPGWGKFHIAKESRGGPLIDIGVHMIDLCYWLMGAPKPVLASAKVYRMFGDRPDLFNADWGVPYDVKEFDVEDYAVGFVRFENEITMQLSFSWAANIPEEVYNVTVLGDKAGITTHPPGVYSADHSSLTRYSWDWLSKEDGHRKEIRHFVECIEEDKPVRVRPEESLQVQKIIDALYESSKRNKEVLIK